MGIFPDAQGLLTPQSEVDIIVVLQGLLTPQSEVDIKVVLVIPKNEEDPIKNEIARVATTVYPL